MRFKFLLLPTVILCALAAASFVALQTPAIPRTPDGKADFQGIWQADRGAGADIQALVEGKEIPYKPVAAQKKAANAKNRSVADPLSSCYMPGVPRIMYLDYPFQIFQAKDHVALTFEWSSVFRLIYTATKAPAHQGIDSWMGDSRGRWEGDALVVDVTQHNDRTWFDLAGNYHSDKMRLTERFSFQNPDTLRYEVTVTDPETFTRPWKIVMPLHRVKNKTRVLEYQCQAEKEEKNGDFEPNPRSWYPKR
jgi:hypothetical protein